MDLMVWIIIATIVAVLPIFFIKKYINSNNLIYLFIASSCYYLLLYSYVNIFRKKEISSTYVLLQILQILIVIIPSMLFFNEVVTMYKMIGITLGIISIYILG